MTFPAAERDGLEPRFGWNFANVRIHTDDHAAGAARQRGARAFTAGHDIFFGAQQYAPESVQGRELLAHELAHVVQQATVPGLSGAVQLQKSPAEPGAPAVAAPAAEWVHKAEGIAVARYVVDGVDFRVGVPIPELSNYEKPLTAIAAEITRGNSKIADSARQVKLCVIAQGTTRFATYNGAPTLALDPADANPLTARHEMGHAIFDSYRAQAADPTSKMKDVPLVIADIYTRLAATKEVEDVERRTSGASDKKTHPAGLWIVDTAQWSALPSEHPWDDPDEFFASARKAVLTDKAALKKSIAKFTKLDRSVAKPAAELLAALEKLEKGKSPAKPKTFAPEAETELEELDPPSKIEDTLGSRFRREARWALDPTTMPGVKP